MLRSNSPIVKFLPAATAAAALLCVVKASAADVVFPGDQIEFFEKNIRPVLVESCYDCHGSHRHENGLRVDSRAAILRGTDYGTVVEAGNPGASKLMKALKHQPGVEAMPKKADKLSDSQIAAFEKWIAMGLPWPKEIAKDEHHAKPSWEEHWAFLPVKKPPVPQVKNPSAKVQNTLDVYVAAKQEAAGLDFEPAADRATLGRRLYVNVTGLQPTYEELQAFVNDQSPDAVSKLIDRLLNSPQYGARWARYWLDVARYSDTEGYRAGGVDIRYPHAYTYRDWVINALNDDLPYDQFVTQQLAADKLLEPGQSDPSLAALGFLTVNDTFQGDRLLQADDRIDAVTRGFMGLTVSCARCHDHKFDPIPTKDYYAMFSIFMSSDIPKELPIIGHPTDKAAVDEYAKAATTVRAEMDALHAEVYDDMRKPDRLRDYLMFVKRTQNIDGENFRGEAGKAQLRDRIASEFKELMKKHAFIEKPHPVLIAWKKFAELPEDQFEAKSAGMVAELTAEGSPVNGVIRNELAKRPAPKSFRDVATLYSDVFLTCLSGKEPNNADWQGVQALLKDNRSPMSVEVKDVRKFFTQKDNLAMNQLENKITRLDLDSPGAPQRAMVMNDRPKPVDDRIMIRGNPGRRGDVAPRGFLTMLGGQKFKDGSGRLELAREIASPKNPLTARVMVNRVWMHHFGKPLVDQTSDFGVQTPAPEQLALLDYLSASFMENGWSLKKLHRLILNSRTWQQASSTTDEKMNKDPENALLTRYNRQRLDYESMRDSMLQISGVLAPAQMGGRSTTYTSKEVDSRRSVFLFVDRFQQETVPAMFDFANPDAHSPQRSATTVPQQALFLLNSPFAKSQSDRISQKIPVKGSQIDSESLKALYHHVLLRDPSADEVGMALQFLEDSKSLQVINPYSWQFGFGQVKRAIDPAAPLAVEEFMPFKKFVNEKNSPRWQISDNWPDKQWLYPFVQRSTNRLKLSSHPGEKATAGIMRWVAPMDATIRISGLLERPRPQGNGIRGWIISNRTGLLKELVVEPGKTAEMNIASIEVKAGEILDFCVTCENRSDHDTIMWTPRIDRQDAASTGFTLWTDAARDFPGPGKWPMDFPRPQTPLSQLAHILMMSNEFQFVD